MLTIAGGILLALLILVLLPVIFAATGAVLRLGAAALALVVLAGLAVIPLVLGMALAEYVAPGYGALGLFILLISGIAGFIIWETVQFRQWKRKHPIAFRNRLAD